MASVGRVDPACASACGLLEPEEGADEEAAAKEASYEGNPICHGLIFIILFFCICSQQEAETSLPVTSISIMLLCTATATTTFSR
jgi:hypothetical protein